MLKYFIKESDFREDRKTLIIVDEEDMNTEFWIGNAVYTSDLKDITAYNIGGDDTIMDEEEAKGIHFIDPISVEDKISDLIKYYEGDLEWYNNREEEKLTQKEVDDFIKYMEENSEQGIYAIEEKVWNHWDGSNWERYVLETDGDYTEWIDVTDEFEDMEEIDWQEYNTGKKTLYKLENGEKVVIDSSRFQGSLWTLYSVNEKINFFDELKEKDEELMQF